jgi:hypothetical protein
MRCTCKDQNGSLLDKCLGTCGDSTIRFASVPQQNDFNIHAERLSKDINLLVNNRLNKFESELREHFDWNYDNFLKGLKEGFKLAREIEDER